MGLRRVAGWIGAAALLLACVSPGEPPQPEPRLLEGAALAQELAASPALSHSDGAVFWQVADGVRYRVLRARETDWFEIETTRGPLHAAWGLLEADPEMLAEVPKLLDRAAEYGVDVTTLELEADELAGVQLAGARGLVIREGFARAVDPIGVLERNARAHDLVRERLRGAIDALIATLPGTALDLGSRQAAADILGQLDRNDAEESYDFVLPSFARRLVRNGWLAQLSTPAAANRALEDAVSEAERLLPEKRYEAPGLRIAELSDALGNRARVLSTRQRAGFLRPAARPAYYTIGSVDLVVRTPPGADPLEAVERYLAVELFDAGQRVARFTKEAGLEVDAQAWRAAYPVRGADVEAAALEDALPPHIVVTRPNGDVVELISAFGVLRPTRDGHGVEGERFYAQAARVLPDAAHLDLIGQYLLVYVYDSPDSHRPGLVGTRQTSGDIHQTAAETLDTWAGGTYRGDCDDLSELYQVITARQGRNAHLIGLPAHAALAWAEPTQDGGWQTYVLQTGHPLVFRNADLARSLDSVYRSFGSAEVLDLTKLEILLRFSGENTRSSWYLSYRIFSDPEYARRMVDIQRDWHFQTYQRAIEKVQRLIADGDADSANYSELAGLYRYTGQHAKAAEALVAAVARTDSAESRLSMSIDRLASLFEAGSSDDANALAREIREQQIPALEAGRDAQLIDPRLALVDALGADDNDVELALETLVDDITPGVEKKLLELAAWISSDAFDPELFQSQHERVRYQLRWYAGSAIALLERTAEAPLVQRSERQVLSTSVWTWLSDVAFHDVEPSESVLGRYAMLGRYYSAMMGEDELDARLRAASPPADASHDHTERSSDQAQIESDLSWISISPPFWMSRLGELFSRERKALDPAQVADLVQRVNRARAAAAARGLDHPGFDDVERTSRLIGALVAHDRASLRKLLRDPLVRDDRRIRFDVSSWIAVVARFLPLRDYGEDLEVWRQEINYKPMYFWIAWSSALAGATDHALLAARLATRQFKDDPAFREEYEFMKRRFAGTAEPRAQAPPSRRVRPAVDRRMPTSGR